MAAGLNDSVPVSRRMLRRAVGLAVIGLVMVIAGLAVWVLGAAGGVVPQSASDITEIAGAALVGAGAVCGLVVIVTLLAAGRVPQDADTPPAPGRRDEAAEPGSAAGPAPAALPPAASLAPQSLPERVPLARRQPPRPDVTVPPPWAPGPAAEPTLPPVPAWSPQPTAEPTLPPAPAWPADTGPAAPPQPVPQWPAGLPPEPVPEPAPEWAHEPAADGAAEPDPGWATEPAAEWAHEPVAGPVPEPAPEWAHEPVAEWVPGTAPVPVTDEPAEAPVTGVEAAPGERPGEPDRARRSSRKPAVGWNPDSAEDWLRVLRGLRVSEQAEADGHLGHQD